jgi:hypothetical protein
MYRIGSAGKSISPINFKHSRRKNEIIAIKIRRGKNGCHQSFYQFIPEDSEVGQMIA